MKGFPNQISDLGKLATGMRVLIELINAHQDARDDGVFGSRLVHAEVAGTGHGHRAMTPEAYLRQQEQQPVGRQSHRTTARGLRELYRMLGFIVDTDGGVQIQESGRQAAALADQPLEEQAKRFWHSAFCNLRHGDGNEASHPYRVLLRLVARRPRLSRAKCALALEARNDSVDELIRISDLADLDEQAIRDAIGVTQTTWNNARKILPTVAIQLGSVRLGNNGVELADTNWMVEATAAQNPVAAHVIVGRPTRQVTPTTIARVHTHTDFDEGQPPVEISPADAIRTARLRVGRFRRHQAIVQRLAARLGELGADLREDPFDVVAVFDDSVLVFEIKTLGDDAADERERVREALAQLCYYDRFHVRDVADRPTYSKVACFERAISEDHRHFLQQYGIVVIWQDDDGFTGDPLPGDRQLVGGRD